MPTLATSTVTAGKAGPKMAAELLPVRTETYTWALLLCAFRNATLVVTTTDDMSAPAVNKGMVTLTELLVKAWMLLLSAV